MSAHGLSMLDVSNVYIYVGDAVRADSLPPSVRDMGLSVRTVAASTHSPTSFASLATGRYPPHHGVETFSDRLSSNVPTLFQLPAVETSFVNSIFVHAKRQHNGQDPIFSVLDLTQSASVGVEDMTEPFILMERGPGGHAPYGDFTGTAGQYFQDRGSLGTDAIRADYRRSIQLDVALFKERLATLRDAGCLDDTLVIYTSDHGEMLGENGLLGHNGPMRPELVYVPTVFVHPSLSSVHLSDRTMHHVDVFPTVCASLDKDAPADIDGRSVLSGFTDEPRPCFWSNRFLPESVPVLSGRLDYRGVWDAAGGHVSTLTNPVNRLAVLAGKLLRSSKRSYMRRHVLSCLRAYLAGKTTYGRPEFSRETAEHILTAAARKQAESADVTLSEVDRQHLKDLGYME